MKARRLLVLAVVLGVVGLSTDAEAQRRRRRKKTPPSITNSEPKKEEPEALPAPPPPPVVAEPTPAPQPEPEPEPKEEVAEEEPVDFEEEQAESDKQTQQIMAAAGAGGDGGSSLGIKLFVDLLMIHQLTDKKFEFKPNHTYVFVQAQVFDDLTALIHVSDDPVFFELTYNLNRRLSLQAGKLLVPFGTNNFHHIIGGRVDQLSSFLPETWGDYGLAFNHLAVDTPNFSTEYTLYALNGFSGVDEPNIADGSPADNNWFKGLGTRLKLTMFKKVQVTASAYVDAWDVDNDNFLLFYAAGVELIPGLIPLPVLEHMRVRFEWARGEVQIPGRNDQRGILNYAFARSGYYAEVLLPLARWLALRVRTGRVNPNNTVTDAGDVEVYEPAVLLGLGEKVWWTLAYQMVSKPGFDYSYADPADRVYFKFFLMY